MSLDCLNLGSFSHGHPDWINVDNNPLFRWLGNPLYRRALKSIGRLGGFDVRSLESRLTPPPNFRPVDLSRGHLPFPAGSMTYVYSSHFLEHISRAMGQRLAREVTRVLKPGGVFRIVTPDLKIFATAYLAFRDGATSAERAFRVNGAEGMDPLDQINRLFSMQRAERYPEEMSPLRRAALTFWMAYVHAVHADAGHQWIYDFEDLKSLLTEVGLVGIRKLSFRVGRVPNLDFLDLERYRGVSLYVESEKPGARQTSDD